MPSYPAKGKAQMCLILPEKLIERIKILAVREKKRPSHVAELLISRGLEFHGKARVDAPE